MSYTPVARWLHWLIAAAIVLQFVLAEMAENAADKGAALQQLALLAQHKSVGISILVLAVFRLAWRLGHAPPPLSASQPRWQVVASQVSHYSLYVLLFALPVSGWLMSSASAYSVSWFNLIALPDLVSPDETLKASLKFWHESLATALFVIAVIHIGAALKHKLWDKDDVLQRMSSAASVTAFVLLVAAGLVWLPPDKPASEPAQAAVVQAVTASESLPSANPSKLPLWQIDYARSHIEFSAEQAGAPFTGRFKSWRADIRFNPGHLDDSQAQVTIQIDSVTTNDSERDTTLLGEEFFASQQFPTARFNAAQFQSNASGYTAAGTLTIKSVSHPQPFAFTVDYSDTDGQNSATLHGTARLDRLALGVGLGDWLDTDWVGQYVDVKVSLVAFVDDPV